MTKGISKHWTPQAEQHYKRLLDSCQTFAERHVIMSLRDLLKYDGRTKQAKRAIAQARVRLATATDEELEEIARIELKMPGEGPHPSVSEKLEKLKRERAELREKGVPKEELACQ